MQLPRIITVALLLLVAAAPAQTAFQVDVSEDGQTFGPPPPAYETSDSVVFGVQSTGASPAWWAPPGSGADPAYVVMFLWVESAVPGAPYVALGSPPAGTLSQAVAQSGVGFAIEPGHGGIPLGVSRDHVAAILSQLGQPGSSELWGQRVDPVLGAGGHTDWKSWVTPWGSGVSTLIWMPTYVAATGQQASTSPHLLGIGNMVQQALLLQETQAGGAREFLTSGPGLEQLATEEGDTELTLQAVIVTEPPVPSLPTVAVSQPLRVRVRNTTAPGTWGLPFGVLMLGPAPASLGAPPGALAIVLNVGLAAPTTGLVARFRVGEGTVPVGLQQTWPGAPFQWCIVPEGSSGEVESVQSQLPGPWDLDFVTPPNQTPLGVTLL